MMEEFGVEIEVKDFFCSSVFRYQHIEIELLAYHAVYLQGEFQLYAHAEIQWVTNKDLMKFNFSEADIPIAQKLYKYHLN